MSMSMTSFFSPAFFAVFLPIALIGYSVTPNKAKKYFILVASYMFFILISSLLVLYLLAATVTMYLLGLWLDKTQYKMKTALAKTEKEKRKTVKKKFLSDQRRLLIFAIIILIGILLLLKYSGFFVTNINHILVFLKVPYKINIPVFLMPVGLSFFSLQALSYIIDVHRGVIKADKNFFRLALFICFFPQIVEGPICRYSQTAEQLWKVKPITYQNLTFGMQRFLFGMMKKLVIADRLDPFVKHMFNEYSSYDGGMVAVAAVCYTVQLYMDFSGSMDAVMGIGQIFGIEMPENFKRPFFSKTISEFWKRWHISLGTWFRDYIFYPVTTTGKMKKLTSFARKKAGNHYGPLVAGSIALFCVWFCNGLWHGSAWNYIFFGMYHFAFILGGSLIEPLVKKVNRKLKINSGCFVYRLLQILRTAALVVIGEMFFRANGLKNGFLMFGKMITDFSFSSSFADILKKAGLDYSDFIIVGITLAVVFAISFINEKGMSLREILAGKHIIIRWTVLYVLILYIVIFGAYGFGYAPVDPLYAQF